MDPTTLMSIMSMMGGSQQNPIIGGANQFLGGMFGNSGAPYGDAMKQYQQWNDKATGVQNPFLQAGQGAMGHYQDWLGGMQDPSKFMNNLMGQYQESPFAKYQQQQGMRAAQNMGSASGLTGSTPLMQQAQQNAQNISSGDMNSWLQNVLGINSQYGAGQQDLMHQGAGAANALSGLYSGMGTNMGEAAFGKRAGQNQDTSNMIGGGLRFLFG